MSVRKSCGTKKRKRKSKANYITMQVSSMQVNKSQAGYVDKAKIIKVPILEGIVYTCDNCAYWKGKNRCSKVKGTIKPKAFCQLWMFGTPDTLKNLSPAEKRKLSKSIYKDLTPTQQKQMKRMSNAVIETDTPLDALNIPIEMIREAWNNPSGSGKKVVAGAGIVLLSAIITSPFWIEDAMKL